MQIETGPVQRLFSKGEGLSADQRATAVYAAEHVLAAAGVSAATAAAGAWIREGWDVRGFPEPGPTDAEMAAADAWDRASAAADDAVSGDASLELSAG